MAVCPKCKKIVRNNSNKRQIKIKEFHRGKYKKIMIHKNCPRD
jgi:hypothetical protein